MILFPNTRYDPVGGAWGLGTVTGYPCSGDVSSLFGATDMDLHAEGHNGTDIAAGQGTPILAPCDMLITDVFSLDVIYLFGKRAQEHQVFAIKRCFDSLGEEVVLRISILPITTFGFASDPVNKL